jgi:hypothetical protein
MSHQSVAPGLQDTQNAVPLQQALQWPLFARLPQRPALAGSRRGETLARNEPGPAGRLGTGAATKQ